MRIPSFAASFFLALALATSVGCGAPAAPGKYPPRAEGCDVTVYPESPTVQADNIGPVSATCGDDISNDDCLRTLKDEACKLGGDIVWGVADTPAKVQGKKKLAGRAAHTKVAPAVAPAK